MFKELPVSQSESSAPETASGTESMMISGWTKLSNWAASTRNTISSARPKVTATPPEVSRNCCDWPAKPSLASGGRVSAASSRMKRIAVARS